jgi:AcrR family transcriptional regulator
MLREGKAVPLASIAKEANVGVATLYRSYPNRESLLEALQLRALRLVVDLLTQINQTDKPGSEAIREFFARTVEHGNQLVLPYHGAPPSKSPEAIELGKELVRQARAMLERGLRDGTVRSDLTTRDFIIFGALIAQPLPTVDNWTETAARQIDLFMDAIEVPAPRTRCTI